MKRYYKKDLEILGWLGITACNCLALNKVECFYLHQQIKEKYEGVHEFLTWDTGLVFNCEFYSHEDLYNNLFKLKFDGMQLAQEG